jgi:hypothetical protein
MVARDLSQFCWGRIMEYLSAACAIGAYRIVVRAQGKAS